VPFAWLVTILFSRSSFAIAAIRSRALVGAGAEHEDAQDPRALAVDHEPGM